jgi:LPLT family lysophospholipid transporter-like MFS transporter
MGAHPVSAFALIGLAASVYAPCKYGLVTETVPRQLLVRANAWLEVSVVLSVIFGIALGGALTGMVASGIASDGSAWVSIDSAWFVSTQTWPAMVLVMGIYFISALFNLGLRPLRDRSVIVPLTRRAIQWPTFWKSNQTLWRDPLGGVSLYVTTLYWGVGAVLQFAVLIWAEQSLGLSLKLGAYLQALVALGVIVGAFLAGRYFKLHAARQAIPWGVLLAILLPVIVTVSNVWSAIPLLLLMGGAGGVLLVPMNALLQHRGMRVLSPGRSIAVQGFNENLCVLLMLAAYSALLAFSISLTFIMLLLALVLLAGMTPLCWMVIRRVRWRAEK